jgi:hypothetical protein
MMRPIRYALTVGFLYSVTLYCSPAPIIGGLANQYVYTLPYDFSNERATRELVGFAWFNAGFIASVRRWVILNIVAPVGGVINFNNSQTGFFLKNDLFLGRTVTWINSGCFNGDGHAIVFSNDLSYAARLNFFGDTVLDGCRNVITLERGGIFSVRAGVTVTLRNMTLIMEQGSALLLAGATSKIIFDNVTVIWKQNFSFTAGSVECKGACRFVSSQPVILTFSTPGPLLINAYSNLRLYSQISIEFASREQREPIQFVDRTSILYLAGGEIWSSAQNVMLSKGTLFVKRGGIIGATQDRCKIYLKQTPEEEQLFLSSNPNVLRGSFQDGIVYAQWI